MNENIISLMDEDGNEIDFYLLEETRVAGVDYVLVADSPDDEDAECLILKDTSTQDDAEAVYEVVEDEDELQYLSKIFVELMDDVDISIV